ncbi:hypothetical protein ABK040_015693 [Willaertia magna]
MSRSSSPIKFSSSSNSTTPTSPITSSSGSSTLMIQEWEKSTILTSKEEDFLYHLKNQSFSSFSTSLNTTTIHSNNDNNKKEEEEELIIDLLINKEINELKYINYQQQLQSYQDLSHKLIFKINNTLAIYDDLKEQYEIVCNKTNKLHLDCEKLVKETNELENIFKELENKLKNFEEFEELNQNLNASGSFEKIICQPSFISTLNRLDDAINFLSNHLDFKETTIYITKHKYLLSKALAQTRDYIMDQIKIVTENLFIKLKALLQNKNLSINNISKNSNSVTDRFLDELQENTLLFIDFKQNLEKIKNLIETLEGKSYRREYHVFLTDCLECYLQQRYNLLYLVVSNQLIYLFQTCLNNNSPSSINNNVVNGQVKGDLFIRNGCKYMIEIYLQEQLLFQYFFKDERKKSRFSLFMNNITNLLYERIRELIIKENRFDTLCNFIEILRNEILQDSLNNRMNNNTTIVNSTLNSVVLISFEPIVHAMIQDIQERLIYLTSFFISNEIAKYVPLQEDLDYPKKLLSTNNKRLLFENDTSLDDSHETIIDKEEESKKSYGQYLAWYPTLEWTLTLLSKLYKVLDVGVFEGLAQEAVTLCAASFIDASRKISEKSDALNGSLFLISHLLILLQELSYFKVSFTKTETTLDFSHLYEGISRFLKGQASFSVTSMIFDLLSQTRPRIIVSNVDSKKDLEKQLKLSCENFILNTVKYVADTCMTFIKKHNITNTSVQQDKNEHIYQEVLAVKKEMTEDIIDKLKYVNDLLPLYLKETKTITTLTQPIKHQLFSLYEQFLNIIKESKYLEEQRAELLSQLMTEESFKELINNQFTNAK